MIIKQTQIKVFFGGNLKITKIKILLSHWFNFTDKIMFSFHIK